jgi:hypothetical protein
MEKPMQAGMKNPEFPFFKGRKQCGLKLAMPTHRHQARQWRFAHCTLNGSKT